MPATVLLATSNPHKLEEVLAVLEPILAPTGVALIGLHEARLANGSPASSWPEPEETGDTFDANACLKARYYAGKTGLLCLADDSGLEVDALGGAPGVRSARYAGADGPRQTRDRANNTKLLHDLRNVPDEDRAARFVCVLALASPSGAILTTARGAFEGVVGRAPRGDHGFGYDPLLVLPDGRTSAELTPQEKNARSHRGAACRAIAPSLLRVLASAANDDRVSRGAI